MLTLTREQGQCIYIGSDLWVPDPESSYDYRIDFDVVDHRVGHRRIEVLVDSRIDIQRHVLTEQYPDLDFAPEMRLAFLKSYEYLKDGEGKSVAKIGIRAPRHVSILRDNATPLLLNRTLQ